MRYLNLYINQITNFNVDWTGLRNLTSLDLSFNGLVDTSLPEDFYLPSLTVLPLCGNKLTTIPAPLLKLSSLRNLDLRFNRLDTIPDDLGVVAMTLRCLKLSNNRLQSLPESMKQLVALEELDLSSNFLESLENVQGLTRLTSLHAYWNGTTTLPEHFGDLVELRELYLTENCIKALPDTISRMVNLRNFMAHYNDLGTIPAGLSGLINLNTLNLAENDLTAIPSEISALTALTRLDLRANILATLPSALSEVRSLAVLEIGDNNFLSIPPVIFEMVTLTSLNLFSNGLSSVPSAIARLPLTSLNLSFNQLVTLPSELANITSLVYLRLEGNFFKSFPEEVVALPSLKELAIGSNRGIKEIPSSISQLTRLATLHASSAAIQYLPDTFVQLKALTELDISHNRLAALPVDMDRLATLTDLDISGNALTRIPPCFGNMRNLQQVKASFNPGLVDVPMEYFKGPTTWISCTGNIKIEGEYYFARKKAADRTGWLLTAEEDEDSSLEPIPSIHHEQIAASSTPLSASGTETTEEDATPKVDPLLTTIAEEDDDSDDRVIDSKQIPAIIGNPTANTSSASPPTNTTSSSSATATSEPDVIRFRASSNSPMVTSAPIAVPSPVSPEKSEKSKKKDKVKDKTGKSPKTGTHSSVVAVHDYHTPSALDDRRLTILPDEDRDREWGSGTERTGTPGTPESSSSPPIGVSPISTSPYLTAYPQKKDKKKDKEKDKEERKREKDLLASSGTSVGSNSSNSSNHGHSTSSLPVEPLVLRSPQVGWAEMRGGRPDMQDSLVIMEHFHGIPEATLIGLFDGHGGADTALLTAKKLPPLMRDALRHVLDERDLEWSLQSLLSLSNADLAIAIRGSFMALHGAVTKAGFTDGTAATIALVLHPFGTVPRTPTPIGHPSNWSSPNLNIIYGDEVYHDANVAGWCEKARATHVLLTNPPTSATAANLALRPAIAQPSTPTPTDSEDGSHPSPVSRPETPLRTSADNSHGGPAPASTKSKKDKSKHKSGEHRSSGDHKSFSVPLSSLFSFSNNSHHSPSSNAPSPSSSSHGTSYGRSTSLLVLGNCGDQRAVMSRKGQAIALTKDHKPESLSEMDRIALSGGFVAESRRVNGLLALSRAIGDVSVQPHVTFEPDIMVIELTEHDEFVILGCDGVWDVISNEQAVFLAQAESSPSRAANRIREYAYSLGSTDNISVVVYQLRPRDKTNFGTCLMTHIAESLAVQAASPRALHHHTSAPLSAHLNSGASSTMQTSSGSAPTSASALAGPLSASAPVHPTSSHVTSTPANQQQHTPTTVPSILASPGSPGKSPLVKSPSSLSHTQPIPTSSSSSPPAPAGHTPNISTESSPASTSGVTSPATAEIEPPLSASSSKATTSPTPSTPSSPSSSHSPAHSPKAPTFAELAAASNSPGAKRRKKAKSNIDLTSVIEKKDPQNEKREKRRSAEKEKTDKERDKEHRQEKEKRRSEEKDGERSHKDSKGSLQRSKDSKQRDLAEKEARESTK